MNIFVLHTNPKLAAQYHNNNHCSKMILETAQILCTVHKILVEDSEAPYKPTHPNHPCTIWARQSYSNYAWLCMLGMELEKEKVYRTGKSHKSIDVIRWCYNNPPDLFPQIGITPFATAMNISFVMVNTNTLELDIVESYRNYYFKDKRHLAKWTKREKPDWWIEKENQEMFLLNKVS